MGNVKKAWKYILPILLLPFFGNLAQTQIQLMCNSLLGVMHLAAIAFSQSLYSIANMALYAAAITGVALPAMWADEGKAKAGKTAHRWCLTVFGAMIAAIAAAFLLLGQPMLRPFTSTDEIIALGNTFLRSGAVAMLGTAVLGGIIGQTQKKYSLTVSLILCGGMAGLWVALGHMLTVSYGASGIGLSQGGILAATRIMPFLMIPYRRFVDDFVPAAPQNQEVSA